MPQISQSPAVSMPRPVSVLPMNGNVGSGTTPGGTFPVEFFFQLLTWVSHWAETAVPLAASLSMGWQTALFPGPTGTVVILNFCYGARLIVMLDPPRLVAIAKGFHERLRISLLSLDGTQCKHIHH